MLIQVLKSLSILYYYKFNIPKFFKHVQGKYFSKSKLSIV